MGRGDVVLKYPKPRVVIVDDSRTMQALLDQTLSARLGFDIVGIANDGASAMAMIRELRPDLVTIDLHMPYISGQELLESLRDLPELRKVVISSHASQNLAVRAALERLGVDACIDKTELSRDLSAFCKKITSVIAKPRSSEARHMVKPCRSSVTVNSFDATLASFPIPDDEYRRLRMLNVLRLANDDEDHRLDLLTAHLVETTSYPSSIMTFVHRDTAWIKSGLGVARGSVPRAQAICSHAIGSDDPLIVPDVRHDDRFRNLDAVRSGEVRAYVGCPIIASNGVRLGALCLLDTKPRHVSPADLINLRNITRIAAELIKPKLTPVARAA